MPKKQVPTRREEDLEGTIVYNIPIPKKLDKDALKALKEMTPIVKRQPYHVEYLHSYGQDSPFFAGLSNRVLLGNRDPETGYTYATPRGADMYTGNETEWVRLPDEGKVHAFTVCRFGSEEFLPDTPFVLALIEFEGANGGVKPDCVTEYGIFNAVLDRGADKEIESKITLDENISAPVTRGDVVGIVEYMKDGEKIGEVEITAAEDIGRIGFFSLFGKLFLKYLMI